MPLPINPPHRYVPTLTEVVHVTDGADTSSAGNGGTAHVAESPAHFGRFVERIAAPNQAAGASGNGSQMMEEEIIHRVLQRIDVALGHRLRRCINDVMLEQTQLILARLREDVERVVRDSVHQAVADELATGQNHQPNLSKNAR